MLTQNTLIGVRDPYGIRPLVIGKIKNSVMCLLRKLVHLDIIGAQYIRDVENGEIVYIENDQLKSIKPFTPIKKVTAMCIRIYIFFQTR